MFRQEVYVIKSKRIPSKLFGTYVNSYDKVNKEMHKCTIYLLCLVETLIESLKQSNRKMAASKKFVLISVYAVANNIYKSCIFHLTPLSFH